MENEVIQTVMFPTHAGMNRKSPPDNFQSIFNDLKACFPWNPFPRFFLAVCNDTRMKFYIFGKTKIQRLNM